MNLLEEMLAELKRQNGSDLHVQSGRVPKIRVEGQLISLNKLVLSDPQVQNIKDSMKMSDITAGRFIDDLATDFRYEHPTLGRYRTNICKCDTGIKITMRNLNRKIIDLASLGFEDGLFDDIIPRKKGLVILTGSTNSGKSTTLASLVMEMSKLGRNIVTLEDPVEYFFENRKSVITQRELGSDFTSFPQGIKDALRMDPDILLIGEMRDRETIRAALLAAETGHLVLSTLHTTDIPSTRARVILPFDSSERNEISTILDNALTMIVAQQLVFDEGTKKLRLEYQYEKY